MKPGNGLEQTFKILMGNKMEKVYRVMGDIRTGPEKMQGSLRIGRGGEESRALRPLFPPSYKKHSVIPDRREKDRKVEVARSGEDLS